jgi:hypothetical protein
MTSAAAVRHALGAHRSDGIDQLTLADLEAQDTAAFCETPQLNARPAIDVYGRSLSDEPDVCSTPDQIVLFRRGRYCCSRDRPSTEEQLHYWNMVLRNIIDQQSQLSDDAPEETRTYLIQKKRDIIAHLQSLTLFQRGDVKSDYE